MRKIGVIMLCLVVVSTLFGCGDNSQSPQESAPAEEVVNDTYIEQATNCWPQNLYGEGRIMEFHNPQINLDGVLFEFAQEYDETTKDNLNLYRVELNDGAWEEVEIPWKKKLDKELGSKNVVIDSYSYTDKGFLYLSINEYSMYPKTYYNDREKYYKDYYLVDQYCFRIDEKENRVERLDLPKLKAKDYYDSNQSEKDTYVSKDQLFPNIAIVLKNGNIFLVSREVSMSGLYSSETCKKIAGESDILQSPVCTGVGIGEDYFALGSVNKDSNNIDIEVYAQDGQLQYTIPTEVAFDEEKFYAGGSQQIMVGVADGEIILATEEGIYNAEFGEEQFQTVVDVKKDNTYYLSPDYDLCSDSVILKGKDEDYYLMIRDKKDYGMDETFLCHYTKKSA